MKLLLLLLLAGCAPAETTGFTHVALTGTHADTSCSDCHGESTTDRASWLCADCHEADRPASHDPGGCGSCHTRTDWFDAGVDHDDFFPLPHRGVEACGECHFDASDRSQFSCIDCHEHRQSRMDGEHQGEVGGYRWESGACLSCHRDGRADD